MALNPFVDYFNHTDARGCDVLFAPDGFNIELVPGSCWERIKALNVLDCELMSQRATLD
jgi:hypothetical protein